MSKRHQTKFDLSTASSLLFPAGVVFIIIFYVLSFFSNVILTIIAFSLFAAGFVFILLGLIIEISRIYHSDFNKYVKWCSLEGFNLDESYKKYLEISKRRKHLLYQKNKRKTGDEGTRYSIWKSDFFRDFNKHINNEDLIYCLKEIRRDAGNQKDLYSSIILPLEMAIIAAFYGYDLYPAFISVLSIVLLTIFVSLYFGMTISYDENIFAFTDDVIEIIDEMRSNNNTTKPFS